MRLTQETIKSTFSLSLVCLCLLACESPSVPSSSEQTEAKQGAGDNGYDNQSRVPPTPLSVQEIICTNSRDVLRSAGNDDFSGLFDQLCSGPKATTELFELFSCQCEILG